MQPKPYDLECVAALKNHSPQTQRSSPFCSTFQTRFCMSSFCVRFCLLVFVVVFFFIHALP